MKKRLLAALLTCVMLFSLLPATALAEEGDVAQIGENTYATLDQAVAAAKDGDIIELLASDALTFSKMQSKSITFTGTGTITVTNQTVNSYGKTLTLTGSDVEFIWDGSGSGSDSWLMMALGGTVNVINGATLRFKFNSETTSATNALYMNSNSVLNVSNGSKVEFLGTGTAGKDGQAIQLDSSGCASVNVTGGSTFLVDGTNRGYVNSPTIYVDDSTFTIQNCTSNASNGGAFTANKATINFLNNTGHGLSATTLDIKNSTVTCNGNGYYGVTVGTSIAMDGTSTLTSNENGWGYTGGALRLSNTSTNGVFASGAQVELKNNVRNALENYGTCTFEDGVALEITGNKEPNNGAGVYNGGAGNLTLPANAVIKCNTAGVTGGGIHNKGTVVVPASVQLYNNHADTAGDDIYNTGTISFGPVGDDWCLDGDPDCDDPIDGWYDDAEGDRWEAHNKAYLHVVEFTQFGTQPTALKAAHGILPDPEPEPIVPEWETSKSKTATNLEKQSDGTYTSDVTLSLPSAEEQLVTDVVFVLDKSDSYDAKPEALAMLKNLKDDVEKTGAVVKVGVVIFNKVANVTEDETDNDNFFDLVTQYTEIEKAFGQKISGGTNTHAGLLAGKQLLDEDTSVSADRKYLIFVSDGISYMYNEEPTSIITIGYVHEAGTIKSIPDYTTDVWNNKYGYGVTIRDITKKTDPVAAVREFLYGTNGVESLVKADNNKYDVAYGTTENGENVLKSNNRKSPLTDEEYAAQVGDDQFEHANNIEKALYLTAETYRAAQEAGYHCYAVKKSDSVDSNYPWGDEFMDYLAGGEEVSFDDIQNDIYYLLSAGSTVVDVMGYDTYGTNRYYNFDFVNDIDKLTLTRGEDANGNPIELSKTKINDTTYGFGEILTEGKYKDQYEFVLNYYANGTSDVAGEHFVWYINVPISQFEPVQLTYTVKLMNPEEEIGTSGEYDADGSEGYDSLYTNNSATLYPIDSDGHKVQPEEFPKPTVEYTVGETGTLTLTKYVLSSDAAQGIYTFNVTIGDAEPTEITVTVAANPETGIVSGSTEISVPFGDTYTVEEVTNSDYTPKYLTKQSGTITLENPTATVAVANVRNDEAALFISKTVSNGGSTTQKFTFTVELTDTNNEAVTGTLVYTGSDAVTTFESGKTVTLTSGNSATIYGLPAGVKYKVTEASVSNYTTTYTVTGVNGTTTGNVAEGTITRGTVAGVHYTNTYTKPSTPSGGSSGGGGSTVLNTDDHYSYIIGYKDGYLRPYGTITRGEVATIFFRLLTDEARDKYWSQTNDYSDCNSDLWCNNAISTLSNMGIIDGYTDGTFRPYGKITRAQFAKIAVGFFETTKKEYQGYYSDVPENAWFTDYVEAASRVGLIQGFEDGTFRPNTNITRAQACVIVNRALNRKPDEDHLLPEKQMVTWPDNNPGDWYYADMQEATNSHDYTWLSKGSEKKYMEDWTKKLEQRNWAAFEHAWSTAHSAPGGEVVK